MKLGNISSPVEISGGANMGTFSIAMNGKAFRVLSDTLYQNKVGSIVREISCNAFDAHVMAGKADQPFEIHLPDEFEPWFSVKDFGVGLSPEDVTSIFTVYFSSTKDSSNETIGAFGLGAKTPFAYTDQFTVTSVKEGVKTIYNAFIAENGVPTIMKMHDEPTDEINGVEINIAVERNDFSTFAREVANQLSFFKVKPIVKNKHVKFNQFLRNPTFSTDIVVIGDSADSGFASSFYVTQGNVGYPIVTNMLVGKISDNAMEIINRITRISGSRLLADFPIGSISVTASREGIEYTKITCDSISKALESFSNEFDTYLKTALDVYPNDWERVRHCNNNAIFARFFGDKKIGKSIVNYNQRTFPLSVEELVTETQDDGSVRTIRKQLAQLSEYQSWRKQWRGIVNSVKPADNPSKDPIFIIKDKTTWVLKKIKQFYDENYARYSEIILVESNYDTPYSKLEDMIREQCGGVAKFVYASSIELPAAFIEKTKRPKGPKTSFYEYIDGADNSIRKWIRHTIDIDSFIENRKKTVVYMINESMLALDVKVTLADGKILRLTASQVNMFVEAYDAVLIAVKPDTDHEDLISAEDFISEKIDDLKNDKSVKEYMKAVSIVSVTPKWVKRMADNADAYEQVPDQTFKKYLTASKTYAKVAALQDRTVHNKSRLISVFLEEKPDASEELMTLFAEKFEKKYPLAHKIISNSGWFESTHDMHSHVAMYIKGVSL